MPQTVESDSTGQAVFDDEIRHKGYECKAEVDSEENTFTAVINTGIVDRDREVVLPKGGDFNQFMKNPVVPFGHNYQSPPIAKALWIKQSRGKVIMKARAAPTDMGQEVFDLIRGGFLNAVSIGFEPVGDNFGPPSEKELKAHPEWAPARTIFREWNLLEVSVVPVPSNAEALIQAVGKGFEISDRMMERLKLNHKVPALEPSREPVIIKAPTTIAAPQYLRIPPEARPAPRPGPPSKAWIRSEVQDAFDKLRGRPRFRKA